MVLPFPHNRLFLAGQVDGQTTLDKRMDGLGAPPPRYELGRNTRLTRPPCFTNFDAVCCSFGLPAVLDAQKYRRDISYPVSSSGRRIIVGPSSHGRLPRRVDLRPRRIGMGYSCCMVFPCCARFWIAEWCDLD